MGRPIRPFVPARLVDDELSQRNFEEVKRITDDLASAVDAKATLRYGAGAPAPGLGYDGDFYLDTVSGNLYVKERGSWL